MALQGQLPSSFGLLACVLLFSCSRMPDEVISSDELISKEKGRYYYNDVLYSGTLIEYDSLGNKVAEVALEKGVRNGVSKYWWPNGNLKREAGYLDGAYHGEVSEFYENGSPYAVFHYEQGHESGSQKVWKSDGRIKANYDVIDGRKYGLTGVKNCINVLEEDSLYLF